MKKIWLIGAGNIAKEYAKVLGELNQDYVVIGRGEDKAKAFEKEIGHTVIRGGLSDFIVKTTDIADYAIVSVGLMQLAETTKTLISCGVKNILVEKPGFCNPSELEEVVNMACNYNSRVDIAYNRRFYSSVFKAEDIICEDGGITSFNFEFTEWGHVIEKLDYTKEIFRNWFYANSTHVVDLAFFLGGAPQQMQSYTSGKLSWHKPSIFSGAGVSKKGALFSYQANWDAPGRWVVEILTPKHRLYFKPMEKLQIQEKGSVVVNPIEINDYLDKQFKPGFYLQTKAFLADDMSRFCSIEQQLEHLRIYYKILNI